MKNLFITSSLCSLSAIMANAFMPAFSPELANRAPPTSAFGSDGKISVSVQADFTEKQLKVLDLLEVPYTVVKTASDYIFNYPTSAYQMKCSTLAKTHGEEISGFFMQNNLNKFSSYFNRHYKSATGKESSEWLFDKVTATAVLNKNKQITVEQFKHSWTQSSIIAKFPGKNPDLPIVIVGSHLDSLAGRFGTDKNRAPGADDDGSGAMTILEVFRVLVLSNEFQPLHPVEFHWYSAEEAGLLGSTDVARYYKGKNAQVKAMLQIDMDGYTGKQDKSVGIVTDNTSPSLTSFVRLAVKEFTDLKGIDTRCNYQCSDHASWYNQNYPSAFTIEAEMSKLNPYIHSASDTADKIDIIHMVDFGKLAIGFAIELSC